MNMNDSNHLYNMARMKNYKSMAIKGMLALLLAGCMAGCSPDEGNYSYHSLNEPDITGVPEKMSVLIHDTLSLNPSLGSNITDLDAYTYEWKVINNAGDNEVTTLSEEKRLHDEVTLNAGQYTLYFTMTDKKSGLFWRKSYALTVSDSSSEGWMVLCDVDGTTRLDIISDVTGKTYTDVLSDKGMPELNHPYRMQYVPRNGNSDSPFYLFTADGATRLSKNNFAWQKEYAFKYEVAKSVDLHPQAMVSDQSGMMRVCVSDGYAYTASNMGIQGLFASVNKQGGLAPYVGANIGATSYASVYLFYDTVRKRFMSCCPFLTGLSLSDASYHSMEEMESIATGYKGSEMVTGNAFDHYPEGLDFVYMENSYYDPGNAKMGVTYTILSDGNGYYVYGIQLGDMLCYADCTFVLGKAYYGDLSGCAHIDKAEHFAFSSLRHYMYYAVGGTIYRVNLSETPLRAEKQLELAGENITMMKFNLYQNAASTHDYDLVVASERNGTGTLRIYDGMAGEGDFSSVKPKAYTGFAKIVDATYRERTN